MSPTNRNLVSLSTNIRLARYAALAGAALTAPVIADAAIVYTGPINIAIPTSTTGIYLNVVTGLNNASPSLVPGWDVNPWGASNLEFFTPTPNPGGGEMVGSGTNFVNLFSQMGTFVIGPSSGYVTSGITTPLAGTLNLNSSNNYFAFRFIDETNGNQVKYGWVQVSLGATAQAQPRAIVSYAYENNGGSLILGFVPEPTTTALLGVMAAGALGVRAWRNRKAAVAPEGLEKKR